MCLVLLGWRAHPEYRLIVAANRDEFHARRTESLRRWPERPMLLAGRDLDSGTAVPGLWTGLRDGPGDRRFAAVTNVRAPGEARPGLRSRGALARDYLCGEVADPEAFFRTVADDDTNYNGYAMLASDLRQLCWYSNRGAPRAYSLPPGFHGLGNDARVRSFVGPVADEPVRGTVPADSQSALPPPSPKIERGLTELRAVVESEPHRLDGYFDLLADRTTVAADALPDTGMSPGIERLASARFVANPVYGTRSSTVLLVREDGSYRIAERSFDRHGRRGGTAHFERVTAEPTGGRP